MRLEKKLAITITNIINPVEENSCGFQPHMPNDKSDFWSVDSNNDWWLGFDNEDKTIFTIAYRYENEGNSFKGRELNLANWLKIVFDLTIKT